MADRNTVPASVSVPIPGFAEAQARWKEIWRRREAVRRAADAERGAWLRSQLRAPVVPNGIVAAARIPADTFVGGYNIGRRLYDTVSDRGAGGFAGSVMSNPDPFENPDAGLALAAAVSLSPVVPFVKRGVLTSADRVMTRTAMRPGYVRVPVGGRAYVSHEPIPASRVALPADAPQGGITLNQVLSDALRPHRLAIEDTIDRTVARTGYPTYFGMTGEVLSPDILPGRIVRHPVPAWNSAVKDRILAKDMPSMPPEGTGLWMSPNTSVAAGPGPSRVVKAYESNAAALRELYSSPEAREAIDYFLKTGDSTNPLAKLYLRSVSGIKSARGKLDAFQSKLASRKNRDVLAEALSGFKTDAEIAKAIESNAKAAGESSVRSVPSGTVKPGEYIPKVAIPWLKDKVTHPWSTAVGLVSYPFRHPWKSFTVGGGALAVGDYVYQHLGDSEAAATTKTASDSVRAAEYEYSKYTGDEALRRSMSDANALKAALTGMRELALAELEATPDRAEPVKARLRGFIDSVRESPAFSELRSVNETAYAARAIRPDEYQREFRERYPKPEDQVLGDGYWDGIDGNGGGR